MRARIGKLAARVAAIVVVSGLAVSCGSDDGRDKNLETFQCQAICQTASGVLGGDSSSFDATDVDAAAVECVDNQSLGSDLCESVHGTFAGRCSCF